MLFVIYAKDKPGALNLRLETREAHLEFIDASGDTVVIAGPLLDAEGKPKGSMLIVDCENHAAAEQWAALDPYAKAGLFADVEIHPWNWVIGAPGSWN
jgi:uncharacterized protein YciI